MNMRGFKFIALSLIGLLIFTTPACKKENIFIYDIEDVKVSRSNSTKENLKNEIEFISIAYADVFGTSPNQSSLNALSVIYLSFGDKKLIEDLIIKNMLNNAGAQIPSDTEMRADIEVFIRNAYLKLYNRQPDEFELWKLNELISSDQSLTAKLIYYSMMTSDEYRYY
jgi:hypothetical protein